MAVWFGLLKVRRAKFLSSPAVGAGARWAEQAGGASGALWGAALTAAGNALGDENEVDLKAQVKAVDAFVNSIMGLGGATVGDKTMIDAQVPFAKEFERCISAGHSAADSWKLAAGVSVNAANATTNLVAKMVGPEFWVISL